SGGFSPAPAGAPRDEYAGRYPDRRGEGDPVCVSDLVAGQQNGAAAGQQRCPELAYRLIPDENFARLRPCAWADVTLGGQVTMQPTLCSRCKKNVAVVFIAKMENGKMVNEGLCLKC